MRHVPQARTNPSTRVAYRLWGAKVDASATIVSLGRPTPRNLYTPAVGQKRRTGRFSRRARRPIIPRRTLCRPTAYPRIHLIAVAHRSSPIAWLLIVAWVALAPWCCCGRAAVVASLTPASDATVEHHSCCDETPGTDDAPGEPEPAQHSNCSDCAAKLTLATGAHDLPASVPSLDPCQIGGHAAAIGSLPAAPMVQTFQLASHEHPPGARPDSGRALLRAACTLNL